MCVCLPSLGVRRERETRDGERKRKALSARTITDHLSDRSSDQHHRQPLCHHQQQQEHRHLRCRTRTRRRGRAIGALLSGSRDRRSGLSLPLDWDSGSCSCLTRVQVTDLPSPDPPDDVFLRPPIDNFSPHPPASSASSSSFPSSTCFRQRDTARRMPHYLMPLASQARLILRFLSLPR